MTPLLLAFLLAAPQVPQERARTLNGEGLHTLFSDKDYPLAALRAGEEGRVQVHLQIGADGIVSRCDVTGSSNSASLDSTTCRLLSDRARFRPARNPAGKAVRDTAVTAIVWKIADESGPPPTPTAPPEERALTQNRVGLNTLFSNDDYPAEALRADEQGTVQVRLHIGADGIVSGCDVIASSNSASLDSTTCRILSERARFSPARDSAGKAVPDTAVTSITWKIAQSALSKPLSEALQNLLNCLRRKTRAALNAAPRRTVREAAEAAFPACRAAEEAVHAIIPPEAYTEDGAYQSPAEQRARVRATMIRILEEAFAAPRPTAR
jgi:TonB family protein